MATTKKPEAPKNESPVDEPTTVDRATFDAIARAAAAEDIADALVEPDQEEDAIIAEQTMPAPEMTGEQATALMNETGLEQLVAQRKALDEQIKAAKAAQPNVSQLEKVIARQATQPKWLVEVLTGRVSARVKAGQSPEGAIDAVLHQYRVLILAALAEGQEGAKGEEEAQS